MTNQLAQWLSWSNDSFSGYLVGFPTLTGKAAHIYEDQRILFDFFAALEKADKEEIDAYRIALDPLLYDMIEKDDSESLTRLVTLCGIRGFSLDYQEVMQSLEDWAVECHAMKAIPALVSLGIASSDDLLASAVERNDVTAAQAILQLGADAQEQLCDAILAGPTMRDLVFNSIHKKLTTFEYAKALQTALESGQDKQFICQLLSLCAESIVNYVYQDGRRPLNHAATDELKAYLIEKGAVPGDVSVIALLQFIKGIHHWEDSTVLQKRLTAFLAGFKSVGDVIYEASHLNGEYSPYDDLLDRLLANGFSDAFLLTLQYIKDPSQISGNVYTAPFTSWNRFDTVSGWESYYQIVRQLLNRRVRVEGNPIAVICNRTCKTNKVSEMKQIIYKVLDLFVNSGVALNAPAYAESAETALSCAIYHANEICIEYLLDNGATLPKGLDEPLSYKLGAWTNYDRPLSQSVYQRLVALQFDINEPNKDGETILHKYCKHSLGELKHIKAALRYGADCRKKSNSGKLPVDLARENGKQDIAAFLEKYIEADETDRKKMLEEEPSPKELLAIRIKKEIEAMLNSPG